MNVRILYCIFSNKVTQLIDLYTGKSRLKNIDALLKAAGLTANDVVKTTVFIKNMSDFPVINTVYNEYFGESKPARSTVEVSRLPKDVLIEIETIALISK